MKTTPELWDVAVIGGGPGGCATALSLRRHDPSLAVLLCEASTYGERRIGETLAPPVQRLLEHLGVWEAFLASGPNESYGTVSAWGGKDLVGDPFLLSPFGRGWHVERARFDALLARETAAAGAHVALGTRVLQARRDGDGWQLRLSDGRRPTARFLVDASGRGARFARSLGARARVSDRLVAFARCFEGDAAPESVTLVESFREGWWYTAGLPRGRRIVACMSDADIARRVGLADDRVWRSWLERTRHVRWTVPTGSRVEARLTRAAGTVRTEPAGGRGWLAVGDAAATVDPLSAQGIARSLRSGIFASYAIAAHLSTGDGAGLHRYEGVVERDSRAHLRAQARYYGDEKRWTAEAFWKRRSRPRHPSRS